MNEKQATEYKVHGFKDRKYSNKQDYQAWLEDLHPAQKHWLREQVQAEAPGVSLGKAKNTRIREWWFLLFNTKMSSSCQSVQSSVFSPEWDSC